MGKSLAALTAKQKLLFVLSVLWVVTSILLSFQYLAPDLFLIREYGWTKVRNEGLHVVVISKQKPHEYSLKLSNGDALDVNAFYFGIVSMIVGFPVAVIPWQLVARRVYRADDDKEKSTS